MLLLRDVAQSGSAPGLGPGGRRFESCHPDKKRLTFKVSLFYFVYLSALKSPTNTSHIGFDQYF